MPIKNEQALNVAIKLVVRLDLTHYQMATHLRKATGLSRRRANHYLKLAADRIKANPAVLLARIDPMLVEAWKSAQVPNISGQPNAAAMVQIIAKIMELTGAAAPSKVDVTSKGEKIGGPVESDEEFLARIARLQNPNGGTGGSPAGGSPPAE